MWVLSHSMDAERSSRTWLGVIHPRLIADATVEERLARRCLSACSAVGWSGVVAGICGRLRLEAGVVAGRFGWVGDCLEAVGFVMVFHYCPARS